MNNGIKKKMAIFVFSPEARWAADNTAINRVLMQMLPALLMGLVILWPSDALVVEAEVEA